MYPKEHATKALTLAELYPGLTGWAWDGHAYHFCTVKKVRSENSVQPRSGVATAYREALVQTEVVGYAPTRLLLCWWDHQGQAVPALFLVDPNRYRPHLRQARTPHISKPR